MQRHLRTGVLTLAALCITAAAAHAWHLQGHVYCNGTGLPLSGVQISVASTNPSAPFSGLGTTDVDGAYLIPLPDGAGDYDATALLGAGETLITPVSGDYPFSTTDTSFEIVRDFVIDSPSCNNVGCWLTGGGAKFSSITGTDLGTTGKANKVDNWGGNVNPGCSPTAGDGGNWNDIDVGDKLHFHGTSIQVVRCGNVDGIPPGSTSPATPFNFIEFQGTGRVEGIQGNKASYDPVYFFGRAEDRNEPGSNGQHDGAGKDRYFLHVWTNPADPIGSTLILVDMDGDPSTVDPLIITDGNMQIHVSSCDTPPASLALTKAARPATGPSIEPAGTAAPIRLALALAGRNPASGRTSVRFALPHAGNASVTVLDVAGRAIRTLASGWLPAGEHFTSWDLRDQGGMQVRGGVYFVRLGSAEGTRSLHLVVAP